MQAVIVSIGHEILSGRTVNTNASAIAKDLLTIGIPVKRIFVIEDEPSEILEVIGSLLKRFPVIICTGGLGSTKDDRTKGAIAQLFKVPLISDNTLVTIIETKYKNLGYLSFPKKVFSQAQIPRGATIFPNPVGSAPGLLMQKNGTMLFLLPGVPDEMKAIMKQSILPYLQERKQGQTVITRTIRTFGIGETALAEIVEPVIGRFKNPALSYLPSIEGVDLMFTGTGDNRLSAESKIRKIQEKILPLVKKWVYGYEQEDVAEIVGKLLSERKFTLAVAESCTGGLLASRLTDISGSSLYFERGIVTYSNQAKEELLNVPHDLLVKYGAVSLQVAKIMAEEVRKLSGSDIALSTTGIMGPTGATLKKPVGLVYVGYCDTYKTIAIKLNLHWDRLKNKMRTVQSALILLREQLAKMKK